MAIGWKIIYPFGHAEFIRDLNQPALKQILTTLTTFLACKINGKNTIVSHYLFFAFLQTSLSSRQWKNETNLSMLVNDTTFSHYLFIGDALTSCKKEKAQSKFANLWKLIMLEISNWTAFNFWLHIKFNTLKDKIKTNSIFTFSFSFNLSYHCPTGMSSISI